MRSRRRGGQPWWSDAGAGLVFELLSTVLEAVVEALASGLFH